MSKLSDFYIHKASLQEIVFKCQQWLWLSLLALGEYLPKLGIKVIWDDEEQETTEKPVINEERGGTDVLDEFCKGLTIFCKE